MFVSYEKMSKKQKAAHDRERRTTWEFKPTTRIKPSAKIYNRKKAKYD